MAQQLEAALLFVEGRREEALVLARQAAVVEDGLSFEFGPPVPVKPAHELVGEMLMDLRRPREAMRGVRAVAEAHSAPRAVAAGPRPRRDGGEGHRDRAARLRRAAETSGRRRTRTLPELQGDRRWFLRRARDLTQTRRAFGRQPA